MFIFFNSFVADDKKLIQLALGLSSSWYVKYINLDISEKRMDIYLDFIKGTKFFCPVCNKLKTAFKRSYGLKTDKCRNTMIS